MAFEPQAYRGYFDRRVQDHHVLFGEVTPAYAMLPQNGFERIRDLSERPKIIFLLREPVDRFFSLLRMKERRSPGYDLAESFRQELADPKLVYISLYRQTFANLMKVFRPDEVHIEFYETLFRDESIRVLCDFLAVPFAPGQYEQRVGAAPTSTKPMPAGFRDEARRVFGDTYAFAKQQFGTRVPANWLV